MAAMQASIVFLESVSKCKICRLFPDLVERFSLYHYCSWLYLTITCREPVFAAKEQFCLSRGLFNKHRGFLSLNRGPPVSVPIQRIVHCINMIPFIDANGACSVQENFSNFHFPSEYFHFPSEYSINWLSHVTGPTEYLEDMFYGFSIKPWLFK